MTDTQDHLTRLAEIAPDSPLAQARATRQAATDGIEASYQRLFAPQEVGGFTIAERLLLAQRISEWHGDRQLAAHYAQLQQTQPQTDHVCRLPWITQNAWPSNPPGQRPNTCRPCNRRGGHWMTSSRFHS
ncbi:Uncharacterized protein conserved in bacteria [Serratia fonticola]|uniref:Uncharacterized protein conserved in bacteria n=1 Tax=Serratia fonticola TaxID=47917 RepID=A0A4U9WN15_SERFO|nr:Uncharacterized protein conserved in bacteria [Serratia fonticola]